LKVDFGFLSLTDMPWGEKILPKSNKSSQDEL